MNSPGLDLNCERQLCDSAKRHFAGTSMNQGKQGFAQLLPHLRLTAFRRCAARWQCERKVKSFPCLDRFLYMVFSQLAFR